MSTEAIIRPREVQSPACEASHYYREIHFGCRVTRYRSPSIKTLPLHLTHKHHKKVSPNVLPIIEPKKPSNPTTAKTKDPSSRCVTVSASSESPDISPESIPSRVPKTGPRWNPRPAPDFAAVGAKKVSPTQIYPPILRPQLIELESTESPGSQLRGCPTTTKEKKQKEKERNGKE